jgi:hypothetical protein
MTMRVIYTRLNEVGYNDWNAMRHIPYPADRCDTGMKNGARKEVNRGHVCMYAFAPLVRLVQPSW